MSFRMRGPLPRQHSPARIVMRCSGRPRPASVNQPTDSSPVSPRGNGIWPNINRASPPARKLPPGRMLFARDATESPFYHKIQIRVLCFVACVLIAYNFPHLILVPCLQGRAVTSTQHHHTYPMLKRPEPIPVLQVARFSCLNLTHQW